MIYLNLKRVRWFGVLLFQNFNKEISYFLTDNLPLVLKLHEICSVDSQKNHRNCCHQMSDFKAKMHQNRFRLEWGAARNPAGEAYSAPPRHPSWIKLGLLIRKGEGYGKGRKGRRGKGERGREGTPNIYPPPLLTWFRRHCLLEVRE